MNSGIWEIGTSNQLFIGGFLDSATLVIVWKKITTFFKRRLPVIL